MNEYVVTVYVTASDRESVDEVMSAACLACASVDVSIKNWIVDDDCNPQ